MGTLVEWIEYLINCREDRVPMNMLVTIPPEGKTEVVINGINVPKDIAKKVMKAFDLL